MDIGVPRETKTREYRVGMTPAGAKQLVLRGHRILIETGAGDGSGISDERYVQAGATVVSRAADAWAADMVVKVKEPLVPEYGYLREGLVLYTYLHLAAEPGLLRALVDHKTSAIAYETIQLPDGSLPLLRPMSEVAGRMARRSAPRTSRRSAVAKASCSEGCLARAVGAWPFSAAASSAATPRPLRSAWGHR